MDKLKEQLCPNCLTGKNTLKLDPKEPFCPFLHLQSEDGCARFKPIVGGDK